MATWAAASLVDRLSSRPSWVAKHHAGIAGGRRNCDDRPLTEMGVGGYGPPRRPWVRGGS